MLTRPSGYGEVGNPISAARYAVDAPRGRRDTVWRHRRGLFAKA